MIKYSPHTELADGILHRMLLRAQISAWATLHDLSTAIEHALIEQSPTKMLHGFGLANLKAILNYRLRFRRSLACRSCSANAASLPLRSASAWFAAALRAFLTLFFFLS